MSEHRPTILMKLCLDALLALLCALFLTSTSRAQFPPDNLVTRSFGGRDALRVQTTLESPPSPMAGIAKVSIVAPKPSPGDRNFVLVIYIKDYRSSPVESIAYRREVRLAEGASRIDLQITFVQPRSYTVWDVDLFEDGRNIENKPPNSTNNSNLNTYQADKAYSASLGLRATGESQAEMSVVVGAITSLIHPNVDLKTLSTTTGRLPELSSVQAIDQASDDWRTYLSYDFIVLTPQGIAQVNERPQLARALRTCVAAGGSLIVTSVADQAEMETVEQFINDSDATQSKPTTALDPQIWWGTELDKKGFMRIDKDLPVTESLKQHGLIEREFGFGTLYLSDRTPDQFPVPPEDVSYLSPMQKTSTFTADSDGDWFWRNLIQTVGKPPVWTFCAIVTLFGALLGPGLLGLTGRMHRRSLMIFLVPAISLVASLAIVAYGVFHEGFETHVRITSVQAIDGDTKIGFAWSRQNYFSGSPPRDGLKFSPHTYARPVYAEVGDNYFSGIDPRKNRTCTVHVEPEQQRWEGWLRPRQQQQLLVGNRIEHVELPISLTRAGTSTLSIKNNTTATLPVVFVRGAGDDYYVTEQLAAGQTVAITSIHPVQAAAKIAKLIADYRPAAPPELGEGGSLLDFGTGARSYSMTVGTTSYQYEDILNRTFERWMSGKMQLPQFGFSLLATESNAVEVPLEGKRADDLHLVVGVKTW